MSTPTSIFKFVSIRNATSEVTTPPSPVIQPKTEVVANIVRLLESGKKQPEKIKLLNEFLNDFISSKDFFKRISELNKVINELLPSNPTNKPNDLKDKTKIRNFYENLYNNIVVRTITKSTTNEVFKLLIDSINITHQKLNAETVPREDIHKIKIILPEGLIFSFSPPKIENVSTQNNSLQENTKLFSSISDLLQQKEQIAISKAEHSNNINIEHQKILKQKNEIAKSQSDLKENTATKTRSKSSSKTTSTPTEISTIALDKLKATTANLNKTESDLDLQLTELNKQAFTLIPKTTYVRVGEKYVDINRFAPNAPEIKDESILIYSHGCYLKFPFQVADLRVIEQKTVGYLPNEIAHINNTQSGEKQEKVTRRLKRIETFESLITEDEVSKETDTQSTEKFTIEKAASEVQSQENSINVNASVSGTYGVVTASVDTGFSHTDSSQNSNSTSQNYAKEIVQKVVDRVSHKVKSERSMKSIEEFEETVTHIIDNTGKGPKSYVYRWLTKLVRVTLKNYGKRLMFQIDIAHPSHYYLSRVLQDAIPLNIPPDPRSLNEKSEDKTVREFYKNNPAFPSFSENNITRANYLAWADLYNAKLEQPPLEKILIGMAGAATDQVIKIPEGYSAHAATINAELRETDDHYDGHVSFLLGNTQHSIWIWTTDLIISRALLTTFQLNNEIGELPFATLHTRGTLKIAIEIVCHIEARLFIAWQVKCYHAIIEAYENLKAEAESKMSDWNPNNPRLNPTRKMDLIKTELKKGALSKMFRCNPFWITDDYIVGDEYRADCCKDNLNAERVRFLETVFDWQNMTYELYPYFYGDKDNWADLLNLSDDDPHFEAFLQASYASIKIPVYRDPQKEIASINFILNNSIANYSVIPDNMQYILDDLKANTPFGYIIDTETEIPFIEIIKEYDRAGNIKIYYIDSTAQEVLCTEVIEFDKEGNQTKFYYDGNGQVVISEIKEGINSDGQKYNYYFNSSNEKIIAHKTESKYDIKGNKTMYYSTDLGIFSIPTDLVILEAGVQDGVELRGYPEDPSEPTSDVIIPKQYSPAIIKK